MSRIYVKVTPNSSRDKVEKLENGNYKVWVTVAPEKGKANKRVVEVIANYLGISKNKLTIIAGKTFSQKIIEILE
ncbi:MAG: DUF167 domain-containing protein [Patescibacteria group bacterium]